MSQIIQNKSKSLSRISNSVLIKSQSRKKHSRLLVDNNDIVKRLKSQNSLYSQAKFVEGRKEQENILSRISEYPYRLGSQKKVSRNLSEKKKKYQK